MLPTSHTAGNLTCCANLSRVFWPTSRHLACHVSPRGTTLVNLYQGCSRLLEPNSWCETSPAWGSPFLVGEGEIEPLSQTAQRIRRAVDRFLKECLGLRQSDLDRKWEDWPDRLDLARGEYLRRLRPGPGEHYLWRNPERLVLTLFDHAEQYWRREVQEPSFRRMRPEFLRISASRPASREDYEQQPCLPSTSHDRVELVLGRPCPGPALFLGDDDLLSLLWGLSSSQEAHVFEIDSDLVEFLQAELAPTVRLHRQDLREGLPREHCHAYPIVFADPMYAAAGMEFFLGCCDSGLSRAPEARLYLSTCPRLLEDEPGFFQGLQRRGLEVEERRRDWNRYPFPALARCQTLSGLLERGAPADLTQALLEVPYLYADFFVIRRSSQA